VEVEAEGALTCLSTVTHLQWRTAARSSGGPITEKEEDVNEVRHSLGKLFEEEGGKGTPDGDESDGEVVATLFTNSGEKVKCDRPAVTPVMRLGGEH
jgi:hypothetical protein